MLGKLRRGDVTDNRQVRGLRASGRRAGEKGERASVPRRAQHRREGVDVPSGHLQHRGELGLDDEQARIGRSGVRPGGVAQRPDEALARGEPGRGARRETGIDHVHEPGDVIPRGSLACLRGLADDQHVLVRVMQGGLDSDMHAPADRSAGGDECLGQDGDRVRLGVGGEAGNDLAEQAAVGLGSGRLGPTRRGFADSERGRAGLAGPARVPNGRPLAEGEQGLLAWILAAQHSVTSATAARAELSSTIALRSAKAATRAWTARLFTIRGRPRDTWWISATASSENNVSERPASDR